MKQAALAIIISSAFFSVGAHADRPAMSERTTAPAPVFEAPAEPIAIEPAPVVMEQQTSGDVVEIQDGETIAVTLLDFPRRGMTMGRVRNELGEPLEISPTVGEPPITSWLYPDRKVFFEGTTVIHAVATN